MPHQPYFVLVLAHSLHGRLRRVHIPHKVIYAGFVFSVLSFGAPGFCGALRNTKVFCLGSQ